MPCARSIVFLGKISFFLASLLLLLLLLSRDWIVCLYSCLVLSFSLSLFVYSKLHINKLTNRTVILVRNYLLDTCAVLFDLFSFFRFATKCYLIFCLIFSSLSCTTAEDFCQVSVCVCVCLLLFLSHRCIVHALYHLSLFFFFRQFK